MGIDVYYKVLAIDGDKSLDYYSGRWVDLRIDGYNTCSSESAMLWEVARLNSLGLNASVKKLSHKELEST